MIEAAFVHAFDWLGFGAKTAVGYGAMQRDAEQERKQNEAVIAEQKGKAEQARLAAMSPARREIEGFLEHALERHGDLRGGMEKPHAQFHTRAMALAKSAVDLSWTTEEKGLLVNAIEEWVPRIVSLDAKDLRKSPALKALRGN